MFHLQVEKEDGINRQLTFLSQRFFAPLAGRALSSITLTKPAAQ